MSEVERIFFIKEADMTNTAFETSPTAIRPRSAGPRLVPLNPVRARVLDDRGRIIGHLDDVTDADGARFRASRYRRSSGSLIPVGEFSRRSDAIDALRYAS